MAGTGQGHEGKMDVHASEQGRINRFLSATTCEMGRKRVAKEDPQLPVPAEALSRRRQGVWSCAGAPHLSLVKPCRHAGMEFREGCGSREILECP